MPAQLARPINIYTFARLPRVQFEDYVQGSTAQLIGWGLNATGGSIQQQLQHVDLMVFSDEECAIRHSEEPPHPSNLCGGVPEGGRGQCSVCWRGCFCVGSGFEFLHYSIHFVG